MAEQIQENLGFQLHTPVREIPALVPGEATARGLIMCVSENLQVARRELVPLLAGAGYEVELVEAKPGKALDVTARPYRLIVIDVNHPNGNGYDVCARTRSHSTLPMMLVLRGGARNDVLRCFQAGADAYVMSPFDSREFLARIGALLRRRPARLSPV